MRAPAALTLALERYRLKPWGIHGIAHWARVLENGRRLADLTGTDPAVVEAFAMLHDSERRRNDSDTGHGARAGKRLSQMGERLGLTPGQTPGQTRELQLACTYHCSPQFLGLLPTVAGVCHDADALDIARTGVDLDPKRLCTAEARELAEWASGRAVSGELPDLVESEWGLRPRCSHYTSAGALLDIVAAGELVPTSAEYYRQLNVDAARAVMTAELWREHEAEAVAEVTRLCERLDAVWCSLSPSLEWGCSPVWRGADKATVRALRSPDPAVRAATLARLGGRFARIELPLDAAPLSLTGYMAAGGLCREGFAYLASYAAQVGSDVGEWRVSLDTIPAARFLAAEVWDGARWRDDLVRLMATRPLWCRSWGG